MVELREEHEADDFEADIETPEEQIETLTLIPNSQNEHVDWSSSSERRRRNRGDLIPSVLVVVLAFFGVSYYFANRRVTSSSTTNELSGQALTDIVAPTIFISIDGFRHDYLPRRHDDGGAHLAPILNKIATEGVTTMEGMQPVVPTKTFPNHWTLVTGLYPEYHGIISNTMYDPVKKKWFHLDRVHPDWWYGEPIWQTIRNTKRVARHPNGTTTVLDQNYTSACVFWPGADVPKHAANAFWPYDKTKSYETRVERTLALLNGTAQDLGRKAQFVTLYFDGVDRAGHQHGPHSKEVAHEIQKVDDAIGLLLRGLGDKWWESFNIVIVSDHGMTEVSEDRVIDLSSTVPEGTVQDIVTSPLGLFLNMTVSADELHRQIQESLRGKEDHASVYTKKDLPERWHLRESRLVTPIITMASLGWTVTYPHQHLVPDTDKPLRRTSAGWGIGKGNHGYDNTYEDMQAIFIAKGPAFKRGAFLSKLRAIDVYEMFCHMFGARSAPNNGSREATVPILEDRLAVGTGV